MRTAKEIINEFKAIADNPRKAMDDYKKETGKGAVGICILSRRNRTCSRLSANRYVGCTEETDFKSTYLSASICMLHYAVCHGITVRRCL